jgi:hypothetical protein
MGKTFSKSAPWEPIEKHAADYEMPSRKRRGCAAAAGHHDPMVRSRDQASVDDCGEM